MQQAFQFVFQLNKDTEVGDLCDLAFDAAARAVLFRNRGFPWIQIQLFQTQSDSTTVLIN